MGGPSALPKPGFPVAPISTFVPLLRSLKGCLGPDNRSESGRAAIGKFVASKRSKAVEFPNDGKQETLAGKADKRQLIFKIGPKKKDDIRKRITGQIGKCTSNDSPSKAIIRDNALSVKCTKKEALRFKKAQMKQKRERQRRQAILQEEHKDRSRDRHGMDVFGKRLTREQIKQI